MNHTYMTENRRRIGVALFCIFLATLPAHAQKLSEEELVEGSGRYAGPSPDDEDFAVEGSGQPADSLHTLRPTSTPTSVSTSSLNHHHDIGSDEFIKGDDTFRTPGGRIGDNHDGDNAARPSTLVVVGIVALVCLLVVVIVALTCCCTRRRSTSEYMPGTTRSKSYV